MSVIIPPSSSDYLLAALLNKTHEDLVLRLFVNDLIIAEVRSAEAFVEPPIALYAPVILLGQHWAISGGVAKYPAIDFRFGDWTGQIHGYFITTIVSGQLFAFERAGPFNISSPEDRVRIPLSIEVA